MLQSLKNIKMIQKSTNNYFQVLKYIEYIKISLTQRIKTDQKLWNVRLSLPLATCCGDQLFFLGEISARNLYTFIFHFKATVMFHYLSVMHGQVTIIFILLVNSLSLYGFNIQATHRMYLWSRQQFYIYLYLKRRRCLNTEQMLQRQDLFITFV